MISNFLNIIIYFLFISGQELLVVLLFVLIFFGAKSIPEFARNLGKGIKELRKALDDIKEEIKSESKEIKDEINEIKNELDKNTDIKI